MTIGRLQVIEPKPFTPLFAWSGNPTSGGANFATPDPKEISTYSAGGASIELDFGAAVTLDSFFFLVWNATLAATATVYTATAAGGTGLVQRVAGGFRAADAVALPQRVLFRFAAVASRYWVVNVNNAGGAALQMGAVAAGLAFEASWDKEFGSGRRLIDTAKTQPLIGGGFGVQPGARKAAYSWTFGDLTDAEVEQLWGIAYRVGNSSPIIVQEQDGATVAANEKLHYGLFQRFEQWDRRDPNATKWSLEVEEWI